MPKRVELDSDEDSDEGPTARRNEAKSSLKILAEGEVPRIKGDDPLQALDSDDASEEEPEPQDEE